MELLGPKISLLVFVVGAHLAAARPVKVAEWRYYSPSLHSQTQKLERADADLLLASVCLGQVRVEPSGLTCATRRLGPKFEITDRALHLEAVILGHFLGPDSDEAVVAASSAEGHAGRWGGTLLLHKEGSAWTPIWYRGGLITENCEKIALPDHREVLLCEDEDSGMGHALHDLYAVDLERPSDLPQGLLVRADSFTDQCGTQKQSLGQVEWSPDRLAFSIDVETPVWESSREPYCRGLGERPSGHLRVKFAIMNDGLRKVETGAEVKR